jgi:hypothetical protein
MHFRTRMKLSKAWSVSCVVMALAVATPSRAAIYWTLFNQEGTSGDSTFFVTYATFQDMATNQHALDSFSAPSDLYPNASQNRVDGGYDGTQYWALFNKEGTSGDSAFFVTYATFQDMATNQHALDSFSASSDLYPNASQNRVGSGSNFFPNAGAVPEPATWAMMIIGFGFLGSTLRAKLRGPHARLVSPDHSTHTGQVYGQLMSLWG